MTKRQKGQMMITGLVRFSYLNAFEPKATPSGEMKYSASILIPKTDKASIDMVHKAIADATEKGIEKGKFKRAEIAKLKNPLRDGDFEADSGGRGDEYRGCFFMNASSANAPGVVKAQKGGPPVPIMDTDEFYSGCYGRADINFFAYNQAGNKGIGVGLNNLLLVKEGERLDGRQKAESAFAAFVEEDTESETVNLDSAIGDLE